MPRVGEEESIKVGWVSRSSIQSMGAYRRTAERATFGSVRGSQASRGENANHDA